MNDYKGKKKLKKQKKIWGMKLKIRFRPNVSLVCCTYASAFKYTYQWLYYKAKVCFCIVCDRD